MVKVRVVSRREPLAVSRETLAVSREPLAVSREPLVASREPLVENLLDVVLHLDEQNVKRVGLLVAVIIIKS